MRRMLLALILGSLLAMLLAGGVALAQTIRCDGGVCTGTDRGDTIIGTTVQDTINALDGKDKVYGLGAHDTLSGQNGNDAIVGDAAPEHYKKDPGDPDWDTLFGGNGADNLAGNQKADVLYAGNDNSRDVLRGGTGTTDGADKDVFVVDREAYASGEDEIIDDQAGLGVQDGVELPSDATAGDLHQSALNGGPVLYYYPS